VEDIEEDLLAQKLDLGLAVISGKSSEGLKHKELLRLPMSLLVTEKSKLKSADDILKRDRIELPLITLPAAEHVCRMFQTELQKRKIDWFATHELSSLDLITRYVAEGFGVGLMLAAPATVWPRGLVALPLEGFPDVAFGALWNGRLSRIGEMFVEEAQALAERVAKR
jgi:DNA-binding transcriptional LysR family regulator